MSILKDIASKLKDHNCEKMVKRVGNEISLTLPTIVDVGVTKINIGLFFNRIGELLGASDIATALDESQYLVCEEKNSTNDQDLKLNCEKIYLQIVLALTQLQAIFESIKIDPSPAIRKELRDWIKYCTSLNKHASEVVSPRRSGKGPGDYEIKDIMRYQNITEDEMDEALKVLEGHDDTKTAIDHSHGTFEVRDIDKNIVFGNIDSGNSNIVSRNITSIEEKYTKQLVDKIDNKTIATDLDEISSSQTQIERYPYARFPHQIILGDIVPLEVIIKSVKPSPSDYKSTIIILQQNEQNKEIPVQVIVEYDEDSFEIIGKYYAIINVPVERKDSNPLIFNIKSKKEGKHTIQIRFFQQTTYVGEIKLEPLVISSKKQEPISVSDSQLIKEWKSDYGILENTIPGPDITIFIHERKISSEFEYDILIFSFNTPIEEMGPIKFQFNPETKFNKIFEDIENFAGDPNIINRKIKAKGMSLYDELFPPSLKELYWKRRDKIKSIRVISKEPWIPWEIIKPWHQVENGNIEEDPFLCEQYAFSRWVVGKPERIKEKIKNIKIIVPNDTNLVAAIKERDWIEKFGKSKNIKIFFVSSYDQVINTLETEKEIDILHFSTHGQKNTESPLLSEIELEDNVKLRPDEIIGKAMTFGQSHPIVILNACQTGNQGFSLTGIQGWATKFLDAGASVFIGTLWSVNDETAFNFVKEFYNQLSSGITLGETVKNARNNCKKEGDTSWLAYQLYGHPNSKINI